MRTLIILVLSCVTGFCQEAGIQMFSSVTTNAESGAILTTETFTRGGQTNLIRFTKSERGAVVYRSHKFCHHGEPIALFVWRDGTQHFHSYPGTLYSANLEFWPSNEVRCVIIDGKTWFDGFYYTNGVFYPAPDSDLELKNLR
jgi:hypothetical protein